uniref:Alpha-latrotoxin n=1 Tax=Rhipicephalus zambeziensis TaxID=60191 RepID=A0A224YX76_9ACAR
MVSGEPVEDLRYLFDSLCVDDEGYETPDHEDDGGASPAVRRRGPVRRDTAPRPCPYRYGSSDEWSPSSDNRPSSVDSAVSLSPPASNESVRRTSSSGAELDDEDDPEKPAKLAEILRYLLDGEPTSFIGAKQREKNEDTERNRRDPALSSTSLPASVEEINRLTLRFKPIRPREDSMRSDNDPVSPPVKHPNPEWPQQSRLRKELPLVACNNAAVVVAKLQASGRLMARDSKGRTYVHEAVASGNLALFYKLVVRLLRDNCCRLLELCDHVGQTALHYACMLRQELVVGVLCEAGIQRDVRDNNGATAMHLAAERGGDSCVEQLLAPPCPGSVSAQDLKGRTPLHLAVLSHGGQLCTENSKGQQPTYETIDSYRVVKLLSTTTNAQLNLQDRVGETALHYAAQHHKVDLVQLLLLNADSPSRLVSIANNAGDTALHMACRSPGPEQGRLVRLLIQHGAPVGALNKEGMRPVDLLPPDLQWEVGLLQDI